MSIKSVGGVFGRNPTFNNVDVDGNLSAAETTVTADSTVPLTVNRTGSQGDTIQIEDDGTKIGTVGVKGGALFLADVSGTGFRFESNAILMTDGDGDKAAANYSLGLGAYPIGSVFQGSGHGIYMNGGTGAANLFDDYEEGTWTPEYIAGTGAFTSITYDGATAGLYTKVGNIVHAYGRIRTDAITVGTASGTVSIGGLPFTNTANFAAVPCTYTSAFAGDQPNGGYVLQSSTNILLYYKTAPNTGSLALDVSDLNTGANRNYIVFSATYQTA